MLTFSKSVALGLSRRMSHTTRWFNGGFVHAKQLPPRPTIEETDLEESFLKGSGPGGQKINKTSSAVQLKHLPTGIVVKSQATRSRSQNRSIARKLLAEKLEHKEKGPESRVALKIDIKAKQKANKSKKARRKYGKTERDGDNSQRPEENGIARSGDAADGSEARRQHISRSIDEREILQYLIAP
ncbi:MAG: hypothetical protein HETSPECPRED_000454 [Heterodermia speciosa]|uniref:Prokaryotic-type class I peptide chain release factors domain-containing protein n=1 Tax=Heterodermia speciosa TaxID=116794 RepID=A0A8H3ER10_9LECA|nr:MAG: hypothetical protein HETSPECPRED_000454 [Heterodermia speciosa]